LGRKAQVLLRLQRTHGNAYVQKIIDCMERHDGTEEAGEGVTGTDYAAEARTLPLTAAHNFFQIVTLGDGEGISSEFRATLDGAAPSTAEEGEKEIEEETEPVQLPFVGLEDAVNGEIGVYYTVRSAKLDLGEDFGMATYLCRWKSWARQRHLPDGSNRYDVRVRTMVGYEWDVDSQGHKHIQGPRDADVTEDTWSQIVYDLAPSASTPARPPRVEYWCQDLTTKHERFHIEDWVGAFRSYQPVAEAWLNAQSASSLDDAITKAGNAVLLTTALVNIYMGKGDSAPCEVRAYADGASLYQERARAVETRAIAEGWQSQMVIERP
jgi:hypothetical protein